MNSPQRFTKKQIALALIDVYLNGLSSIGNDAGWRGDSVLSLFADYGTGLSGGRRDPSRQMIEAIRLVKTKDRNFAAIFTVVSRLLDNPGTRGYMLALLVRQHYQGLNDETDRSFTVEDKVKLWHKHMLVLGFADNYPGWDAIERQYRHGAYECGPRLIFRDFKLSEKMVA